MNPVVVIPTFVSPRSQREGGSIIATYDHPTPLSQEGDLPRCLESLTKVEGIGQIIVLVAAEPSIAHKAALHAGRVIACTAIDLFTQPERLAQAKAEFDQAAGGGYVCPVPPDAVPVVAD